MVQACNQSYKMGDRMGVVSQETHGLTILACVVNPRLIGEGETKGERYYIHRDTQTHICAHMHAPTNAPMHDRAKCPEGAV